MVFEYGEKETEYLKSKDKRLGEFIDRTGHIERETDGDLFTSVVHQIVGQQISSRALETVWSRLCDRFELTPAALAQAEINELSSVGISGRKAEYITSFAKKVQSGEFDTEALCNMSDGEAIKALSSLRGIGVWTAEMILLFCLQRKDILSFDDLGIRRGMQIIYNRREITRDGFEKIRRRLSPYGSVASLYFWAAAGGTENKS